MLSRKLQRNITIHIQEHASVNITTSFTFSIQVLPCFNEDAKFLKMVSRSCGIGQCQRLDSISIIHFFSATVHTYMIYWENSVSAAFLNMLKEEPKSVARICRQRHEVLWCPDRQQPPRLLDLLFYNVWWSTNALFHGITQIIQVGITVCYNTADYNIKCFSALSLVQVWLWNDNLEDIQWLQGKELSIDWMTLFSPFKHQNWYIYIYNHTWPEFCHHCVCRCPST